MTDIEALKRTRRGGPRTRKGCTTCKIRHVKCDEQKPECYKCTSTGRRCDGYQTSTIAAHHERGDVLVRTGKNDFLAITTPWGDSQITLDSILGLPPDPQGRRLYHSFLHQVLPALSKSLDAPFWQTDVLRNSSSRPAVQNAAIALGALYEQQHGQFNGYASSIQQSSNSALSTSLLVHRYSTAIQCLHDRLAEAFPDENLMEEVMIASLLFVCIEILRDDDIAAVTHLEGALGIYLNFCDSNQNTSTASSTPRSPVMHSVLNIYTRLDIQAAVYIGSRSTRIPFEDSANDIEHDNLTVTFHTLLEARDDLNLRITRIVSFITPLYGADKAFPGYKPHPIRGFDRYSVFHGSPYRDYTPAHVNVRRRRYMKLLSIWKSAFQEFLQKERETLKKPKEMAEIALIWSSFYIARIRLIASYTKDEVVYDQCLPQFKKVVEQAELVRRYSNVPSFPSPLDNEREQNKARGIIHPRKTANLSVHVGLNFALYLTALKCRFRPLRQRAMELLRTSERESVWDGEMLACIASYVIEAEEGNGPERQEGTNDRADRIQDGEELGVSGRGNDFGVPEAKRLHCLALNIDKEEKRIWLLSNRREPAGSHSYILEGGEGQREQDWIWIIESTVLSW